jgi:hypothetical protein
VPAASDRAAIVPVPADLLVYWLIFFMAVRFPADAIGLSCSFLWGATGWEWMRWRDTAVP